MPLSIELPSDAIESPASRNGLNSIPDRLPTGLTCPMAGSIEIPSDAARAIPVENTQTFPTLLPSRAYPSNRYEYWTPVGCRKSPSDQMAKFYPCSLAVSIALPSNEKILSLAETYPSDCWSYWVFSSRWMLWEPFWSKRLNSIIVRWPAGLTRPMPWVFRSLRTL